MMMMKRMAVLFGDGALLVLFYQQMAKRILSAHLHSDGKYIDDLSSSYPSSKYKDIINEEKYTKKTASYLYEWKRSFRMLLEDWEVILEGLESII